MSAVPSRNPVSGPRAGLRSLAGTAPRISWRLCAALAAFAAAAAGGVRTSADVPAVPLSLTAGVAIALRQSPGARAAWFQRESARAEAERGRPAARPTLDVLVSGALQGPRATFARSDGDLAAVLPEEAGRIDLIFEQPIYHAGAASARRRYNAQYRSADLEYRRALSDIALTVRTAYADVLRAASGAAVAKQALDAAIRYEHLVRRQIDSGLARPVDADTVMAQVAEAREGMGRADGELSLARYGFNRALGRPLNAPAILESALPLPIAPQTPDAALAVAGRERPELLILKEQLLAAKAGAELASSESRPTLSVRGEVNEQTPTAFTREHYAAVSLQMRWPILDGDRAKIDTTQARAEARRVETLLEDARLGIMLEVLRAWQKMCDARTAIDSAAVRVHAYQVTETVAEKAYEVGRGTVIEVQSARRELNDARERLRRATYDLYAADAEFDHAQGRFPAGAPTGTPAGLKE